ncbi:MAG TPA: PilZ domain-containing protein, partial [Bacillaceae bacterium]|nr:PilZ domain-containing protein [Bacillaceae bacterium]
QRRRYFRVQVAVEMNLILPSTKDTAGEKLFVHTYDISGGGAAFIFRHPVVKVGDLVNGSLQYKINSDQRSIDFTGRIVNVMKQENHFYRISLQFMEMNELIRTDIIKFCMYKQIELRKKTQNTY